MNIDMIREELEEDLKGQCICGYITKGDMVKYLDDFNIWAKTARIGDTYVAQEISYTYEPEYEVAVWKNYEQRETGEPIYMTPSQMNIEKIKEECESYILDSTGCIEIFEEGEDDALFHYENGKWSDCTL